MEIIQPEIQITVEDWLEQNALRLTQLYEQRAKEVRENINMFPDAARLTDESKLALTDMSICTVVDQINTPEGFTRLETLVVFIERHTNKCFMVQHKCFRIGQLILDITPGQFLVRQWEATMNWKLGVSKHMLHVLNKGRNIQILDTGLPNESAIILGHHEEIANRYGFRYLFKTYHQYMLEKEARSAEFF